MPDLSKLERFALIVGIVSAIVVPVGTAFYIGNTVGKMEERIPNDFKDRFSKLEERVPTESKERLTTLENQVRSFVLVEYTAYRTEVDALFSKMLDAATPEERKELKENKAWVLLLTEPSTFATEYSKLRVVEGNKKQLEMLQLRKRDLDFRAALLKPPK